MDIISKLDEALRRFDRVKRSGDRAHQYMALCPAHADSDHSLAVGLSDDGRRILLHCLRGCERAQVMVCARPALTEHDLHADAGDAAEPVVMAPAVPPEVWRERVRAWAGNFAAGERARVALSYTLDVPEEVFVHFPDLGARADHPRGACWCFPETDAHGVVTGVCLRFKEGSNNKMQESGSKRGLFYPADVHTLPGPLYLVEGASDVIALRAAGIAAVGRCSNVGGVALLAQFIKEHVPADREIVWMGENDARPSKKDPNTSEWPGRDDSIKAAAKLAADIERPVLFALPPNGQDKDMRCWSTRLVRDGVQWCEIAARLNQFIKKQLVKPAVKQGGGNPPPRVTGPDGRAVVHLWAGCDEVAIGDEVVDALKDDPVLFVRAGSLSRVIQEDGGTDKGVQYPRALRIEPVQQATLRSRITKAVVYMYPKRGVPAPCPPPDAITNAIRERGAWPGLRPLYAVVDYPFLRPDGTVMSETGYDPQTGVYLERNGPAPLVPEVCDRAAALLAWEGLTEVIRDFPFARECHRAAWLCGLLSALARFAFDGPVPLFLVDGNTPGTGKSKLATVAGMIATGSKMPTMIYSAEDEEMRKRFTSLALRSSTQVLLDNVRGAFGGTALDAILTSTVWQDRLLGSNSLVTLPWLAVSWATGNNVQLAGDALRRVIVMRLLTTLERPEERTGFLHENLEEWVIQNRPRLLGHALTILIAHHRAGRPACGLNALGSYEGWSRVVRNAVVWLGLPDPGEAKADLREASDPQEVARMVLVDNWHLIDPDGRGVTSNQIAAQLWPRGSDTPNHLSDLADAVNAVVRQQTGQQLATRLREWKDRPTHGRMITKVSASGHVARWGVVDAPPENPGEDGEDEDDPRSPSGQETDPKNDKNQFRSYPAERYPQHPPFNSSSEDSGTGFADFDKW